MFSKDNIMVFPHSACIKIEQTFDEIEKIVKVLEEKIEKECKGSPLLFQNSESSGGEKVVLLEDPEELLTKIKKSVEWMKGAKEDVSGMRTMVFENKFSEKKDKISIVTIGKILLPRLSEVGENKKTMITGDHREMKEDMTNPGTEVHSFYGKFASAENTQRTMFLVPLEKEISEKEGYRYMPEENHEVNGILMDLSELSMKMCENLSYLHNWYGGQAKGNYLAMKEWIQDNWTSVACSQPALSIKSANDLDLKNPKHLNGIIECVVVSRNIKSMPLGGFFVEPANNPTGRVSTKSYALRPSKRESSDVERGWLILGARYLEEWKHACAAKGMDVKGADTKDDLQQDAEGLPVDAAAMWKFMKDHVDHRYVERALRNIEENLEIPVPLGKCSSSCFDLLGPDLRPVQVKENHTTRLVSADEYYAMIAKDLSSTGGVVASLMEICPRTRDIYANLTGLRIIYPSRFVSQVRAPWELQQNIPKDMTKKISLWIGTDGIVNQTRVMDLTTGGPGQDDAAQLHELTRCRSSLRAANLPETTKKHSRGIDDAICSELPPTKKMTLSPREPAAQTQNLSCMGEDEFA